MLHVTENIAYDADQEWCDILAFMMSDGYRDEYRQLPWWRHGRVWVFVLAPLILSVFVFGIMWGAYTLWPGSAIAVLLVALGITASIRLLRALFGWHRRAFPLFLMRLAVSPYRDAFERFRQERRSQAAE